MKMYFNEINIGYIRAGDFIVIRSDEWWVYDGQTFRMMTVQEQIEASR